MFSSFRIFELLGLSSGHQRTLRAKKNIAASIVIKGISITIGLILVPLTITYLSPTKYGIWITLSSVIGWFSFFNIGLGNGLRNRFAESIARGKHDLAKTYVSTTYALLSLIIGGVLLLFMIINPLLNWSKILNSGDDVIFEKELSLVALIVFTFFCLSFVFKLITTVLTADQQPAKASLFDLMGKILSLAIIFILTKTTHGSLLYLGIVMGGIPLIVLLASSIWFYNGKYRIYKPSLKSVDFSKAKDLFNLGFKFFFIQIAAILLYQTNNIIISQLFGPAEVTPYSVAFKYMSVMMMGFTIIISPFWSAFTEAWVKNDINWIKKIMNKLIQVWGILFLAAIIMLVLSPWVYHIWVGEKVTISYTMSALIAIWVVLNIWNGIFSQFLNGVGKIRLQLYIGVTVAILNVPLAIFLGIHFGINGVLLANVILIAAASWFYPLQYKKLISNSASGVWNK